MPDIVDTATRSRMMAGIRGKNTRPEMLIRRALHGLGFRYRLHDARLPGKPDLVFRRLRAVIFVHGCFWHGHDCHLFRLPGTRQEFWRTKIEGNRERDARINNELALEGWRILTVRECAMRGKERMPFDRLIDQVVAWLRSDSQVMDIRGAV